MKGGKHRSKNINYVIGQVTIHHNLMKTGFSVLYLFTKAHLRFSNDF